MARDRKKPFLPLTRRQMLKGIGTGLALDPVSVLIDGLLKGIVTKAANAVATEEPRNHVLVALPGAPPHWVWDGALNANRRAGMATPHPSIVHRFNASGDAIYSAPNVTVNGETLSLPYLWSCTVPKAGGGFHNMTELLRHWFGIVGIDLEVDGHRSNLIKQERVSAAAPSLAGTVADASNAALGAVAISGAPPHEAFSSRRGGTLTLVNPTANTNPLQSLLYPFLVKGEFESLPADYRTRREAMRVAVNAATDALGAYARARGPGYEVLERSRSAALSLFSQGLDEAIGAYPALLQKYTTLIARSWTDRIAGINNVAVPTAGVDPNHLSIDENMRVTRANLVDLIQPASGSTIRTLAEGFAAAEFLLVRGLCASALIGASGYGSLFPANNNARKDGIFDEHRVGKLVSLMCNTWLYRSIAACILELKAALTAVNKWDDTVVQVGGDMNRVPRRNGAGSDHGFMAQVVSVFAGHLTKPVVVGNIRNASTAHAYLNATHGTDDFIWGESGPTSIDGSARPVKMGNVASTIARLLRVNPPLPNEASLVDAMGNPLVPKGGLV